MRKRYYAKGERLPPHRANLYYISRKIRHMERMGIPADHDPVTGAATPKWLLEERAEKRKGARRA